MEATQMAPVDIFAGVIQTGLSFGVWIVFSLAGHVIGKKLQHSAPWLAWIPIVNLGYYLSLAGRPAWQLLLLFVPIVGVFVYAKMFGEIAERLGMQEWLGWCMLLPVANTFIIAYLAASGASRTPARTHSRAEALFDGARARTW